MKAIRESGVRYVLVLSSVGADLPDGTGLIAGLHSQEERLKKLIGTNILQPPSIMSSSDEALESS